MAQPFLLRRTAHTLVVGPTTYSVWSAVGVDYGNVGSEADPPTVAYVNQVDNTNHGPIAISLPLSAEGVEPAARQATLPWYRHFISVRAGRRWGLDLWE